MRKYRTSTCLLIINLFIYLAATGQTKTLSPFSPMNGKAQSPVEKFAGDWKSDSLKDHSYFSVRLFVKDEIIMGQHCLVSNGGLRIDCCESGDTSIVEKKRMTRSAIQVEIKSQYNNVRETISLKVHRNFLTWKNLDTKRSLYFPKKIRLKKVEGK